MTNTNNVKEILEILFKDVEWLKSESIGFKGGLINHKKALDELYASTKTVSKDVLDLIDYMERIENKVDELIKRGNGNGKNP